MLSRVSQLIAISLLCLVGCSGRASNNNEPAFPKKTSVTESELSGCWSQSLGVGGTLLKNTYTLESGVNYTRRIDTPRSKETGILGSQRLLA